MGARIPGQVGVDDDPFNFELDTTGIDFHDIKQNPNAAYNGLSDFQRFVVQNFFDTQPKRKRAMLKQFGFEMSKDGESIRPLGSDGSFKPIDPGFFDSPGGFIAAHNLFTEKGREEIMRDVSDLTFDAGSTAAIAAASTAGGTAAAPVGAAAGTAVAPGIGSLIGGALTAGAGAFVSGAAANTASETMKFALSEIFLDEEVPWDAKETFYQSVVAGGLGTLAKGGSAGLQKMVKSWQKWRADKAAKSMKNALIRKSNNTFSDELAEDFMQNPENYSPEAVDGATKKLLKISDEIYGTSVENPHSTRQLKGGVAKERINSWNARADLEIEKLSHNPEARFTVEEIVNTLEKRVKPLRDKKFNTKEEERVLDYVNGEISRLKDKMRIEQPEAPKVSLFGPDGKPLPQAAPAPEQFKELTFKEGRDLLKSFQNAAYEEGPLKGSGVLKQVTHNLKEAADKKAGAVKSDLPEINAKRSEILNTYSNFQSFVKSGHMQNAYIGKDNISRERARQLFEEMDRVLDTNMSKEVQSAQFQSAVEQVYKKPGSMFGSGNVVADMVEQGAAQGVKGAFRGGSLGGAASIVTGPGIVAPAATAGFVGGVKKGVSDAATFVDPERVIKKASKIKARLDDVDAGRTFNQQAARIGGATVPAAISTQADVDTAAQIRESMAPPPVEQAVAPQAPLPGTEEEDDNPFNFELDMTGLEGL